MKNIILSLILLLLVNGMAAGQFKTGESFVGGGFYNNLARVKQTDTDPVLNSYNHNINVVFGKFVQNNKALGWGITQRLVYEKYRQLNIVPEPLKEIGFGIERFGEYYKSLNDKFALYVRPSVNLGYTLTNTYQATNTTVTYQEKMNSIALGVSLSAGITWRLSPKWALYGGFAFINPIDIGYGFGNSRSYNQQFPNEVNAETNVSGFEYSFQPELSSGSIGLGFRYFW